MRTNFCCRCGTRTSSSHSELSRAPCRFRDSPTTHWGSRPSRTRSTSEITCSAGSRSPLQRRGRGHRRRELTFVFVGAGYAGVEALAELADLVRDALRYYPTLRDKPQHWVLVDAAPTILPEIPRKLGDYAARELERRGVDIRAGTTLESVEPHAAVLSDGDRLLTSTVVWTAGVRANPVNERLGMPLDERGRIVVDETLHVEGVPHTWALGDGARVPNRATPGEFDPPTCQHALRQARRLAKNLTGEPKPYRYRMLGQAATLGRY